jgi:hypothetical protein
MLSITVIAPPYIKYYPDIAFISIVIVVIGLHDDGYRTVIGIPAIWGIIASA